MDPINNEEFDVLDSLSFDSHLPDELFSDVAMSTTTLSGLLNSDLSFDVPCFQQYTEGPARSKARRRRGGKQYSVGLADAQ